MNAYELELYKIAKARGDSITRQLADIVSQQADQIVELEKVSSNPVAWIDKDTLDATHIIKAVVRREQDEQHNIPLYTHPHKELSDEEISLLKAEIEAHKKTNQLLAQKIVELEEGYKR